MFAGKLKNISGHGKSRTYDHWNASPKNALPTELRGQIGLSH